MAYDVGQALIKNYEKNIMLEIVDEPSVLDCFSVAYAKADTLFNDFFSGLPIEKAIELLDPFVEPTRSMPEFALFEDMFIKATIRVRDKYVPYDDSKKNIYIEAMKEGLLKEFIENRSYYKKRLADMRRIKKELQKLKGTLDFYIKAQEFLQEYRCKIF